MSNTIQSYFFNLTSPLSVIKLNPYVGTYCAVLLHDRVTPVSLLLSRECTGTDLVLRWLRLFFAFSILQLWWTWGQSSTSTENCKKLKPITFERCNWSRMTPSPSPTCASCGTSWKNRAWGPQAPELTLSAYLPYEHQAWVTDCPHAPNSLFSSGRDGRDTGRSLCHTVLPMTPVLCIQLRPAAFLRSLAHSLATIKWYLDFSVKISALTGTPFLFSFFFLLYLKHLNLMQDHRPPFNICDELVVGFLVLFFQ